MPATIPGTPPSAPVGTLKLGTTGVDGAGNIWLITLSGNFFVAQWTGALPRMDEAPEDAPPDESQVVADPEPEDEPDTRHGRHGRRR